MLYIAYHVNVLQFNMMVYNPLGRNWTGILRVPLSHSTVQVTAASDGNELVSQVHYLLSSSTLSLNTAGNTCITVHRASER